MPWEMVSQTKYCRKLPGRFGMGHKSLIRAPGQRLHVFVDGRNLYVELISWAGGRTWAGAICTLFYTHSPQSFLHNVSLEWT